MSVHEASSAVDPSAVSARLFSAAIMQAIPPVSEQEILQAYQSTATAASLDPAASLLAMHVQNNVLFRLIIHSAWRQPAVHSGLCLFPIFLPLCILQSPHRRRISRLCLILMMDLVNALRKLMVSLDWLLHRLLLLIQLSIAIIPGYRQQPIFSALCAVSV